MAAVLLAAALALSQPSPSSARANVACDVGVAPAAPITDKLGIGNPLGDACNALTDPVLGAAGKALDPLREAAGALGQGIFAQITTWVSDGAVWLLGEVAELSERTTSPDLLGKGFLRQYRQMALIAALMAALMLLLAVFEALGRGEAGMLWRAFLVTAPLAAIATSAAYVVVQLLIATDDGLCKAIAQSSGADAKHFFKGAIEALGEIGAAGGAAAGTAGSGPGAGTAAGAASGAVEVPLFVGFIAAVLAAFAAFFVWIELLMRDAAIYVVALFMPLAIAASIWPRWASALRRSCELVVVIVFSKFVIVAIVSLAASLLAQSGGRVEHVLAAGAMLLLACFSPFVLFKLVPFAEGALSAAYNRQSASGGALRGVEHVTSVQMMRRAALSNWGLVDAGATGGGTGKGGGRGGGGSKRGSPAGGGPAGGSVAPSAEAGAGGAAAALAMPVAAAAAAKKAGHEAAGRSAESGAVQAASGTGEASGAVSPEGGGQSGRQRASRPRPDGAAGESDTGRQPGGAAPEPSEASGGKAPGGESKPPRPAAEPGPVAKEAKP